MLQKLYGWYGKRTVWIVLIVIVALLGIGAWRVFFTEETTTASEAVASLPLVNVASVNTLTGSDSISLVGTVASFDRAILQSEASGRVVRVPVTLGQTVGAGSIIAQLENAAERAAVVQAEGAYEAAVAAAAQSTISVSEAENNLAVNQNQLTAAKNSAITVARNSYSAANDLVRNTIDQFFSSPNTGVTGLRIDGEGYTSDLVEARIELRTFLPNWRNATNALTEDDDILAALDVAESNTQYILGIADIFIAILPEAEPNTRFSVNDLAAAQTRFAQARSTLTGLLDSINQSRTNIRSAQESVRTAERALERARIGGSNTEVSAADAQVKQALGSLQAAQANLANTIIRTPITGEVNELHVTVGDYVAARDAVATVANNDALEITTYVGQSDRSRISVDDEVTLGADGTGIISAIAPAVSDTTGKVEVKIQTTDESLQSGESIDVIIDGSDEANDTSQPILLPITAIRFTAEDGYVLSVSESNELMRRDVTLGNVRGNLVEVHSGISLSDEVVVDARGLAAGQEVEVTRN